MNTRLITCIIIAGSFLLLSAGLVFSPSPTIIPEFEKKIENHYSRYPQQKVYLHLDKLSYQAGEKIWYKAYLLDARTHMPDTISKNLLVEIVNSYGTMTLIQLAKLEKGSAKGDFHLPDTMREGLYQIRAYTNWMRNSGSEYFFKRNFNIWNPGNYINLYRDDKLASKKQKRKSNKKARKLDLQFFPEGGYLVDGITSTVGIKSANELGLGLPVSGSVFDKKNNLVARFQSSDLGMGTISFTPEAGMKYKAEIDLENGKTLRFNLPEVQTSGYHLHLIQNAREGIKLSIGSTFENPAVFIACHIRGKLLFTSEVSIGKDGVILDIPTTEFPSGILHITLFDSKREPRCERLAFIHSDDIINLSVRTDKQEYQKMGKVELTLVARNASGQPVEGEFSLSVSDRNLENNAADFQTDIISNLLLSSDIGGRIEKPDFYFKDQEKETLQALDFLMLTQGWRRFNWEDIMNENTKAINYPIQNGILVRGTITKTLFDRPLKNVPVTLTVLSEFNDVFITRTDSRGQYEFELPDYEDTIQVEITARRLNGKKNLVIYIEDSDLEKPDEIFSTYSSEMAIRGTNTLKPLYEPEVDSMQPKTEGIYSTPDYVLYVDENMQTYSSVFDMMQGRIPGVVVNGNDVQIRGPSSFYGSTQPLYLIDNVPTDAGAVASLNPADIERIEVLKGPSAAIYGVRGANGVIAIFTKRGRYIIRGKLTFEMLGYHRPLEFYSPTYGTDFDDLIEDNRSSLYWSPSVKTDSHGKAIIRFYNSEKASTYYIVAEGLSPNGELGRTENSYLVK